MHLIILFVNEVPDNNTVMCQAQSEKVKGNYNFASKTFFASSGHEQTNSLYIFKKRSLNYINYLHDSLTIHGLGNGGGQCGPAYLMHRKSFLDENEVKI